MPISDHVRIALDITDALKINSKFFRDKLFEDSFVTLTVAVCTHQYGNVTLLVDANFSTLVKHASCLFYCVRHTETTQFTLRQSCLTPIGKAIYIRYFERPIHVALEFTAIVVVAERCLIRKGVRRDHVAPPEFHLVDPHLSRRLVDHPLHSEGRLRPAGATIRISRRTVGEDTGYVDMHSRRAIDPGNTAEIAESGQRSKIAEVGSNTCLFAHAQTEEGACTVERQFNSGGEVPRMFLKNPLRSFIHPFDRPTELFRSPDG